MQINNLTITINCEDDALQNNETELVRILKELATKIERGKRPGKVWDSNGNPVGAVKYE